MEAEKEKKTKATASATSLFTDDLILEILCRLPARSLHRFKCVSVAWRDLIADPANRKKLLQTLAGFLYTTMSTRGHRQHLASSIVSVPLELDPYLQLQRTNKYQDMRLMDACNGLLVYRCCHKYNMDDDFRFVVSNPVTGRWVELELPPPPQSPPNTYVGVVGLAFDPAVSSHFHLVQFQQTSVDNDYNILDSEIKLWYLKDCDDSKEWVLKHTANLDKLTRMIGKMYRVVDFHPDCDTIFMVSYGGSYIGSV